MFQYGKIDLIVDAVRSELAEATTNIPWVTDGLVIVSDEPNASPAMPQDRWIVVTPSPQAQFDPAALGGGSWLQATVRSRVIVTVHHGADLRDVPDRINEFFMGESRSINIDARAVIKTLIRKQNWEGPDGLPLLNDPILPAETNFAKAKSGGSIQIAFDIEYDEDLT